MRFSLYLLLTFFLFLIVGCSTSTIQDVPQYLCDKLENSRQQGLKAPITPNFFFVSGGVFSCSYENNILYGYFISSGEYWTQEFYDASGNFIGEYSGDIRNDDAWTRSCSYKGTPCFKIAEETCLQKQPLCEFMISRDTTSTYNRPYKQPL